MSQPKWKCVVGAGNSVDENCYWAFVDETGVYAPEIEVLRMPAEYEDMNHPDYYWDQECTKWFDEKWVPKAAIYRFIIEKTHEDEWYWEKLGEVARCLGMEEQEMRYDLVNGDVQLQAWIMAQVADYFGGHEFDSYPLSVIYKEANERRERYLRES